MSKRYKGAIEKLSLKEEAKQPAPVFLKFNFSYLHKDCLKPDKEQACCVMNTLVSLSNRPFLQIRNERKSTGFETVPTEQFNKRYMTEPAPFDSSCCFERGDRRLTDKRDVFRIRDTKLGRIIGKIYRNIFYIFYFDFAGEAYDHGK